MFERIIEIILYVVGELKANKTIAALDIDKLMSRGYTSSEISTAFSWLVDRIQFSGASEGVRPNVEPVQNKSFRVFDPAELELFTGDALKNIFQLSAMNLISIDQIERLIEKATYETIGKMDDAGVKREVAYTMTQSNASLPHGYRFTLLGNESIN